MSAVAGQASRGTVQGARLPVFDYRLLTAVLALLAIGWIMVVSASMTMAERQLSTPFFFAIRQGAYIGVALLLAGLVLRVRMSCWNRAGVVLLALALVLLALVLVPGIGHVVNGSARWIRLGLVNLQVSEPAKLFVMIYLAGYLVRRTEQVRHNVRGFLLPLAVLGVVSLLLLLEPDFGATAVLMCTAMVMMFLAGVRWWQFGLLFLVVVVVLGALAVSEPYRLLRLTSFMNPWADPYDSGFQLTQSLIAFGRGEWAGVGLGAGVQKLFYLPEAHTDFVFAVLGEEIGLVGVLSVIALYAVILWRAFAIGRMAEAIGQHFSAYLAYGIGTWLGLQSLINMGVAMGALPTKGLTLPLFSYGGSSMVFTVMAVALLLRIDFENRGSLQRVGSRGGRAGGGEA